MENGNGLGKKRKEWAQKYVENGEKGRQAAIDIGIPSKRATKYAAAAISDPKVQAYISELKQELALRNEITKDYFVLNLKQIQEKKGTTDSNRIAALRLLAEITGYAKPKDAGQNNLVILKQASMDESETITLTS